MYKHILIPTDGSRLSEEAAATAIRMAKSLGARVTVLHVVPEPSTSGIDAWTHDDEQFLTIEMADDGPGIDPAERTRVFEAFFFKREGGIGLGLAIVQQIVGAHGGDIEAAESKLGGALFRIRLPRRQSGDT